MWKRVITIALTIATMVFSATTALAQDFWVKGYNFTYNVGATNQGSEAMTVAVSATYNTTTGQGMENIRVFSRDCCQYPGYVNEGVNRVKARFQAVNNTNNLALSVYNSTPSAGPGNCGNAPFAALAADLWGVTHAPGGSIVGYLTSVITDCGGVTFYSQSGTGYDKTVDIYAGTWRIMASPTGTDLPTTIAYDDSDYYNDHKNAGVGAWINFYLDPAATSFNVQGSGSLDYMYADFANGFPMTLSSDPAIVSHTIH